MEHWAISQFLFNNFQGYSLKFDLHTMHKWIRKIVYIPIKV